MGNIEKKYCDIGNIVIGRDKIIELMEGIIIFQKNAGTTVPRCNM